MMIFKLFAPTTSGNNLFLPTLQREQGRFFIRSYGAVATEQSHNGFAFTPTNARYMNN